jgi:hypothetical protein
MGIDEAITWVKVSGKGLLFLIFTSGRIKKLALRTWLAFDLLVMVRRKLPVRH